MAQAPTATADPTPAQIAEARRTVLYHAARQVPIWRWIDKHFICRGEDGRPAPFRVEPHMARFLADAFPPGPELPYNLAVLSMPKKSGKTTSNAAIMLALAFTRFGPGAELYVFANNREQAVGRVFRTAKYAVQHSPDLADLADVYETSIRLHNGTTIQALAAKDASIAGANPSYSAWTELWGYTLEAERRAWEEMTPPPTVRDSVRVVDTYAGWEGESRLLWDIYQGAMRAELLYPDGFPLPDGYEPPADSPARIEDRDGLAWCSTPLPVYANADARFVVLWDVGLDARRMPWQVGEWGERYYESERQQLRAEQYNRLHLNLWAKREGLYVDPEKWAARADAGVRWEPGDRRVVVLAVDAAKSDDHMALVGAAHGSWVEPDPDDEESVGQVAGYEPEICYCMTWEPEDGIQDPRQIAGAILELQEAGMRIAAVAYDPYQFHTLALDLAEAGVYMVEFDQGKPREEADTILRQRIEQGRITHGDFAALNAAVLAAGAKEYRETTGERMSVRIVKGTGKVDPLVAASMAVDVLAETPAGSPRVVK